MPGVIGLSIAAPVRAEQLTSREYAVASVTCAAD